MSKEVLLALKTKHLAPIKGTDTPLYVAAFGDDTYKVHELLKTSEGQAMQGVSNRVSFYFYNVYYSTAMCKHETLTPVFDRFESLCIHLTMRIRMSPICCCCSLSFPTIAWM